MAESLFAAEGTTSDHVSTETNQTGQFDSILEISPESDGVGLILQNFVDKGDQRLGFPVYADLRDSNDDPLPTNSRVAFAYQAPTDESWTIVSKPFGNIKTYRTKDIGAQQDRENIDQVKHQLEAPPGKRPIDATLEIRDVDQAFVLLESSTQIDWSNSEFYIAQDAVEEVDTE